MITVITYNDAEFRQLFPNLNCIPAVNQAYWDTATNYISDVNGGCYTGALSLSQQTLALNLMTAHLVYLYNQIAAGQTSGIVTNATIDKISVTIQPPPETNQWQYWLNQSPYGQQLLALLQVVSVGGYYVTANAPAQSGFQNVGWGFRGGYGWN